ncbi:MAG: hypothetical protein LBN30_00780 [Oscillospiraceae bacterium]|jgi:hypothetical protein|nr:hypothetical protein [Oscillospiraceae bacterium]
MYNRYIGNTGQVIRVDDTPAEPEPPTATATASVLEPIRRQVNGLFDSLLPGVEMGDVILLLLFLFLFLESGDEEFLIMLAFLLLGKK